MSRKSSIDGPEGHGNVPISFGQKYAKSEQFAAVFREGMALVEETAEYLDGQGRREARGLIPPVSLAYATESMRLTTRLMQLASWLLIRRAVNEGELAPEEAEKEEHKVKLKPVQFPQRTADYESLPGRLRELIDASLRLHQRVVKLDGMIHDRAVEPRPSSANPLNPHMSRLKAAFERD